MKQYGPLPLPENPTFDDLVFRRHRDGRVGHLHALHATHDGKIISVTIGGLNDGTPEAPYEMMDAAGETHAPLTEDGVTEIMRAAVPRESSLPVETAPLRLCGYCETWNSRPCGEGCYWSPTAQAAPVGTAPTIEELGAALDLIMSASREDQHTAASSIAGNIGMDLVSEPPHQPPAPVETSERDRIIAIYEGWMERFDGTKIHYASTCDADAEPLRTGVYSLK